MNGQQQLDYERVSEAIAYIRANFRTQPSLEEVAQHIHLSPFHFQRLFTRWAGTTPKKFLQYVSISHAKKMLEERQATLLDTALETGLSGTSRLHDLFVHIEGMTPAEYKHGGRNLSIRYSFAESPFGPVIVASTPKGVCYMAFRDGEEEAVHALQVRFPNARLERKTDVLQQHALCIFGDGRSRLPEIRLHLRGTGFQLKVWEALLKIPAGCLSSYGEIATEIGSPRASRAVGSAIGSNPVAFLIPCHRVIRCSGDVGGYMWGETRKTAIIGWEGAKAAVPAS